VNLAVEFEDQAELRTVEVHDPSRYHMLPVELHAQATSVAQ